MKATKAKAKSHYIHIFEWYVYTKEDVIHCFKRCDNNVTTDKGRVMY